MRTVYLIRHGHPDFPLGAHMCLGRTDTPLGAFGRMQAALLGAELGGRGLAVYTSPLTRCRETAAPLGGETAVIPALAEQDMGPWDGLDFGQIRERWPELYARRGAEPLLVPEGAETLAQLRERVLPAFRACLVRSEGDLAVVVHASVIQAILAELTGTPLEQSRALRPPYGSCAVLEGDGELRVVELGRRPSPPMTPALAEKLLTATAPGERAEAHCRAVAAEALRIARALPGPLDLPLLESAALLHDAARGEEEHAAVGASWLRELGYEDAAALVAQHHDLRSREPDEAAILYLADKCVQEDRRVTLSERFAQSESRCKTAEAKKAHRARLLAALRLRDEINEICGKTVVE
jgi:broad specificity phosphatase PhoE